MSNPRLENHLLSALICLDPPRLVSGHIIKKIQMTPPVIDVLLLKYIECIPAERSHLSGGRISTSQAIICLTHGGQKLGVGGL